LQNLLNPAFLLFLLAFALHTVCVWHLSLPVFLLDFGILF
jgi:hypothetical protein